MKSDCGVNKSTDNRHIKMYLNKITEIDQINIFVQIRALEYSH